LNMKATLFMIFLALALPIRAGTITGTVRATGKAGSPNDPNSGTDAYKSSRALKFVEIKNYEAEHEFVVFIVGKVGTNAAPAQPVAVTTRKVAQRGAVFSPRVLPVVVGTTVEWPNFDDIYHNVFSMSDAKPFDLDLYKGNPPEKRVTFDQPGRVDVFCSIHSQMSCVVLVLENPYFASTDAKGRYTIANVPAGTYKLKAWYERLPAQELEVTVPETGEVKMDFTLGVKNLPKY
jgi:plastocyanin